MVTFTNNSVLNSTLANMLESDSLGEDCLDIIELHGFLTASLISPAAIKDDELLTEVLGQDESNIDEGIRGILKTEIDSFCASIERQLLAAEALELPCELDVGENEDEPSDLERWCMAFVEKHLNNEAEWFNGEASAVAEMLLPILVTSGLFEDEEIASIRKQEGLFVSMIEQIPEVVVDLYGLFHQD